MKKLILILFLTIFSCASGFLPDVSTEGLTHKGNSVYLNDVEIAYLSATELSWDNGRIVTELTFQLTSPEYNGYALSIIKLVHEHNKHVEIEVELKNNWE